MIRITILGSTGTIGVNTLDVLSRNRERFDVYALTAHRNVGALLAQCQVWEPPFAVMADEPSADALRAAVRVAGLNTEVLGGAEALTEVASADETHYVMAGSGGAAGLLPTLAAARRGKRVLLANKEALVMAGPLFMEAVRKSGAELVPIDSEHNAIFQCMPSGYRCGGGYDHGGVRRIVLTGSGGPIRCVARHELEKVPPEQACAHPNWVMGRKISVDSATMMNKGLEVIEACWLFATDTERVKVVIHPQSIIHSMVEYSDGSVIAQLGAPDMRTPIAHALGWPERVESGVSSLDFTALAGLDFEEPDLAHMPCLRLGYEAAELGGTAPAVLNAANEVAVAAFLEREVRFTDIPVIIEATLAEMPSQSAASLETVLEADAEARRLARELIGTLIR